MVAAILALSVPAVGGRAAAVVDIRPIGLEVKMADPALKSAMSRPERPGTTIVLAVSVADGHVLGLDTVRSSLTEFADDRHTDLRAAGGRIEEADEQARGGQRVGVRFGEGIANGIELDRVSDDGTGVVNVRSLALPASGATQVRLRGRLGMSIGRNAVTDELPNVKLEVGTMIRLGNVQATLRQAGSPQSWILSSDAPLDAVVDVHAIGPDGIASGTFGPGRGKVTGFFTSPGVTQATLRVRRYGDVAREEVPFDLVVGLGMGTSEHDTTRAPSPDPTAPTCVNAYAFPIATGGRWAYEETDTFQSSATDGGPGMRSVNRGTTTVTRRAGSAASFSEHTRQRGEGSESTSSVEWSCGTEGLRASPDVAVTMLFSTEGLGPWKETGVDVPPSAAWRVGAKWRRVAEATRAGGSAGKTTRVVVSSEYEIVAREPVTVPAGTYDALKVHSTAALDAEGSEGHGRLLTTTTTAWYAEHVGIVRSESVSTFSSGDAELPGGMRVERTLALQEFSGDPPH